MKVKENFIVREIAGSYLAVPVEGRTKEVHGVIALSETGAFLWKLLEVDQSIVELARELQEEYEVSEEVAIKDVTEFVTKLGNEGWLYEA